MAARDLASQAPACYPHLSNLPVLAAPDPKQQSRLAVVVGLAAIELVRFRSAFAEHSGTSPLMAAGRAEVVVQAWPDPTSPARRTAIELMSAWKRPG